MSIVHCMYAHQFTDSSYIILCKLQVVIISL